MNHPQPKATFFQVKDNAIKIGTICKLVQEAMKKEKKIIIHVPNEEAAKYIDALLWKTPEESFLPHVIANKPTKEWVVITETGLNLNEAPLLLNLRPSSPSIDKFEEIYEFYEIAHPEKVKIAENKMKEYEAKQIAVNMQPD